MWEKTSIHVSCLTQLLLLFIHRVVAQATSSTSLVATSTTEIYAASPVPTGISSSCQSVNISLLSGQSGYLSSQPNSPVSTYSSDNNCVWKLLAPPGQVIQLTLLNFSTECAYDILSIYDGYSSNLSLLQGVFSGPRSSEIGYFQAENIVVSSSNELTLQFQSDSYISSTGFTASYTAIDSNSICTIGGSNCLNGGNCIGGSCVCPITFRGPYCQFVTTGYSDFTPRKYHSAAYDPVLDCVYISGGQDSSTSTLHDIFVHYFGNNSWVNITGSAPSLQPRKYHSSWIVNSCLILWGGFDNSSHPMEIWMYKPFSGIWTVYPPLGNAPPIGLQQDASTLIPEPNGAFSIYVVGGLNRATGMNSLFAYKYSSITQRWIRLSDLPTYVRGGRLEYVSWTNCLHLIFGARGYSNYLESSSYFFNYRYYITYDYWDDDGSGYLLNSRERTSFSTVVLNGAAILGFGGMHMHQSSFNSSSPCFNYGFYVYDTTCEAWYYGAGNSTFKRMGHASIFRNQSLYMIGGDTGNLQNDIVVVPLPDWTQLYLSCANCTKKPSYCSSSSTYFGYNDLLGYMVLFCIVFVMTGCFAFVKRARERVNTNAPIWFDILENSTTMPVKPQVFSAEIEVGPELGSIIGQYSKLLRQGYHGNFNEIDQLNTLVAQSNKIKGSAVSFSDRLKASFSLSSLFNGSARERKDIPRKTWPLAVENRELFDGRGITSVSYLVLLPSAAKALARGINPPCAIGTRLYTFKAAPAQPTDLSQRNGASQSVLSREWH